MMLYALEHMVGKNGLALKSKEVEIYCRLLRYLGLWIILKSPSLKCLFFELRPGFAM
jgi:hypothetical protein